MWVNIPIVNYLVKIHNVFYHGERNKIALLVVVGVSCGHETGQLCY